MTAIAPTRVTSLPEPRGRRAGLRGALASEWTKLRTVRSTWICLAIIVVAGVGLSALVLSIEAGRWAHLAAGERALFDPVRSSQTGLFLAEFVVGVLGALVVTSEYGTGAMRTTLASVPHRTSVLIAKLLVVGAVVLVVAEVTAFASFFVGQAVLLGQGGTSLPAGSTLIDQVHAANVPVYGIGHPGALRAVFFGGLYLVLLTFLACAIGFILRHTAGSISTYVGVLLVLPLIVSILPSSFANSFEKYLPSNLGLGMTAVTTRTTDFAGTLLTPWVAAGVLAAYAVLASLLAGWLLVRRDA